MEQWIKELSDRKLSRTYDDVLLLLDRVPSGGKDEKELKNLLDDLTEECLKRGIPTDVNPE